jgi:hypothetical protein
MDILEGNLRAGISVQKFVPSYGDAPNDLEHVTKCKPYLQFSMSALNWLHGHTDFKEKFRAYQVRGPD